MAKNKIAKRVKYKLMTDESANAKLAKSSGGAYRVCGLSLAPGNISGHEMCRARGECFQYCVGRTAGNVVIYDEIMEARIRRTNLFVDNPAAFFEQVYSDLKKCRAYASREGRKPGCRMNTFSDLPWEIIRPQMFADFADFRIWDYSKIRGRIDRFLKGQFPPNYHLTYSLSEKTPAGYASRVLSAGGTVAAAIDISIRSKNAIPSRYLVDGQYWPTIDGDISDLRFLDKPGHVVILRAKGNLLSQPNNFVRSTADEIDDIVIPAQPSAQDLSL